MTNTKNKPRAAGYAQHTPGPWAVDTDLRTGDLTIETDHDPVSVARICHQDPQMDGGRSFDMERANARLIAAAPELLAALKSVLADGDAMHTRHLAQNAIIKAEGSK